jgi:glycosyltransferase involved in cell wall biosynthesis
MNVRSGLPIPAGAQTSSVFSPEERAQVMTSSALCASFCIAARNEEQTLPQAVAAIVESSLWPRLARKEILICVNGATDNTAKVALALADRHPEVVVMILPTGGKCRARNDLVAVSSRASDTLFFVDADVRPAADTFEKLQAALDRDPALTLVGACSTPFPEGEVRYTFCQRHFARFFSHQVMLDRRVRIGLVAGCCYAIRRSKAASISLPQEAAIGDDVVLNAVFRDARAVLRDAPVYFVPPNFLDRARATARHRRSYNLLRQRYPQVFAAFHECYSRPFRLTLLADYWRLPFSVKFSALTAFTAMMIGWIAAHVRHRSANRPWTTTSSTKKAVEPAAEQTVHG